MNSLVAILLACLMLAVTVRGQTQNMIVWGTTPVVATSGTGTFLAANPVKNLNDGDNTTCSIVDWSANSNGANDLFVTLTWTTAFTNVLVYLLGATTATGTPPTQSYTAPVSIFVSFFSSADTVKSGATAVNPSASPPAAAASAVMTNPCATTTAFSSSNPLALYTCTGTYTTITIAFPKPPTIVFTSIIPTATICNMYLFTSDSQFWTTTTSTTVTTTTTKNGTTAKGARFATADVTVMIAMLVASAKVAFDRFGN